MLDSLLVPAPQKDSRWLMVVLHGLGDSLAGYRWLPDALGLPWMGYLLVNAPDHYFGGYSWYDFAGDPAPGVARSRRELTQLLEGLEAKGQPASRTFLFGFSQGCLMSYEVGMSYPRALAGIIGVSGYVLDPVRLTREMPPVSKDQRFLITHGDADPLIPLDPVRRQVQLLQQSGVTIDWREFRKEHTIAGEEEIEAYREFLTARKAALDTPR